MRAHLTAQEGPLKGLAIDFTDADEWIIGKDPEKSDYILDDPTLDDLLLLCKKTGNDLDIENLTPEFPVYINGEELSNTHRFKLGDELQIGDNLFLFREEIRKKESDTAFDAIFEEDTDEDELPPISAADTEPQTESEEEEPKEDTEEEEKTAYDTIFEDQEDYEELPFNLMGESSLLLKVIAGPNAGAEIAIHKGRSYVLGKDPKTSDIVFQDMSVSKNHARISVSDDGVITLEDLGSKNGTFVSGNEIEGNVEITNQDLVAIGTTTFLIIDREAETDTIYAPQTYEGSYPTNEEEEEETEEVIESAAKEKIDWKKMIIPREHLMIGSAFVVVIFIVFLSFFALFKSESPMVNHKPHTEQLQKLFKSYDDLTYNYTPSSGKLFVVGHVLTSVSHEELMYEISQMPFVTNVDDNIVIDEYVAKSMNDVLIENGGFRGINVSAPKAGRFAVSGYLEKMEEMETLDDYLISTFPYPDRLKNEVVVEGVLTEEIISLLQAKDFLGLNLNLTNGMVTLGGRYDEKKESSYKALLKDIGKIQGVRGVKNYAVASNELASRIDLSNKYQITGYAEHDKQNVSVVVNGQIVMAGESFDGMQVTKILPSMVLLESGGLKYRIDYVR